VTACLSAYVLKITPKLRMGLGAVECEYYHVSEPPSPWHDSCPPQIVPTFSRPSRAAIVNGNIHNRSGGPSIRGTIDQGDHRAGGPSSRGASTRGTIEQGDHRAGGPSSRGTIEQGDHRAGGPSTRGASTRGTIEQTLFVICHCQ
jgi:hypothetical protein